MARLQVILACILSAAMATAAMGQYPMGPGGMYPGMAGGGPPGPDAMMYQGTYPPVAQYRQAVPAPPPMKLPPGVRAEQGLLYYNGAAYADNHYAGPSQFYPQMTPYAGNPIQQVGYEQSVMQGAAPGAMPASMQGPPGPYQSSMGFQGGDAQCARCSDGDGECDGPEHHGLWGFPGKLGFNWSAGVDALVMTRTIGSGKTLVINSITGDTVLRANNMEFEHEPGGRAFVALTGPSGIQYEGVYMWIDEFHARKTAGGFPGEADLGIPLPLGGTTFDFFNTDQITESYTSRIQSAEANVLFPLGCVQFLVGYRYFDMRERANLHATNFIFGESSDFDATAINQMHGGQFGLVGKWEMCGWVAFDWFAKAGFMDNFSSEHQTLSDLGNSVLLRDTSGSFADIAYVSELMAQLTMPLGSYFSIQSGYRVFFINRAALAPNQFDFATTADAGTHVRHGANVVLHGVNLGLTAQW
jgi:hypothetical protein